MWRRLDDTQGWTPVKPESEPEQSEAGGIGSAPWFAGAFLVERQLFAQKKVLGGKGRTWRQTEAEEAQSINEKRQQYLDQWAEAAKQGREARHRHYVLLRSGWF